MSCPLSWWDSSLKAYQPTSELTSEASRAFPITSFFELKSVMSFNQSLQINFRRLSFSLSSRLWASLDCQGHNKPSYYGSNDGCYHDHGLWSRSDVNTTSDGGNDPKLIEDCYFFKDGPLFYKQFVENLIDKILLMTGFEPRISVVRSDHSTNWATTSAQLDELFLPIKASSQYQR